MSDQNKITFTAYLQDDYTQRFAHLASEHEQSVNKVVGKIDSLSRTGQKAAMAIKQVDDRLTALHQVTELKIDSKTLESTKAEIAALQKQKDSLQAPGPSSDSRGDAGSVSGTVRVEINTDAAKAGIADLEAEKQKLAQDVSIDAKTDQAKQKVKELEADKGRLARPDMVAVNDAEVRASGQKVNILNRDKERLTRPTPLKIDGKNTREVITDIYSRLEELTNPRTIGVDTSQIERAKAEIAALHRQLDSLVARTRQHGRGGGGGQPSGGGGNNDGGGDSDGGGGLLKSGFKMFAGLAIADKAKDLIKQTGEEAVAATAKYQKYEAVLTNTLGNNALAKKSMDQLNEFANKTPFQVDELTESFVKLANQGFKPTMTEMTKLGDIAASKGKSFDQFTEALIDAEVGEFERLKEFGIRASKDKDKVTFSFKGQEKTVQNTSAAIREYILSLGDAAGVSGSMAAISKTTGGQISNMEDNVDMLYKALGERLTPQINGSIGSLNSMVTTIRSWIEVPVEQKLNSEISQIRILQAELFATNTSEARRKELLEQLEQIQPRITEGINKEAINYAKLAENINIVTDALYKKIAVSGIEKEFGATLEQYGKANSNIAASKASINDAIYYVSPELAADPTLSQGQKQRRAMELYRKKGLKTYDEEGFFKGLVRGVGSSPSKDQQMYNQLAAGLKVGNEAITEFNKLSPKIAEMQNKKNTMLGMVEKGLEMPTKQSKVAQAPASGSGDKKKKGKDSDSSGNGSIQGGQKITHIITNIQNLVGGGVHVHSTTVKEGAYKVKDIVQEALLTAVNDVNLAAK
ncbi:hypothetical protein ACTJIJ_23000 [Niabella sp. 22666]|uniref:hypothetical protein n=1 Tax=Niabella sp. 22666 TaxID=3453954 RepID=UPI003F82BDF1